MAGFVQVVEWRSERFDEVMRLGQELSAERTGAGGPAGPTRLTVTADRARPGTYLTIIEFDSYDEARASSDDPRTSEFARRMAELCDGPLAYRDLDVRLSLEPAPA